MKSTQQPAPGGARSRNGVISRFSWVLALAALILIGYMGWSLFRRGEFGTSVMSVTTGGAYLLALAAFVLSGVLIVSRQPGNAIGWLLMIPGVSLPVSEIAFGWLLTIQPPGQTGPALWMALWFTSWSWVLLIFPVFHLLLTFPGGTPLSSRWYWTFWLEGAMVATMVLSLSFSEELQLVENETTLWSVPNPIGFISTGFYEGVFQTVWSGCLLFLTLAAVTAVFLRFRRGSYAQRQQVKWLLGAVCLFGAVYGAGAISSGFIQGGVMDLLFGLSLAGIPAAVAIAVLRYRLYEIDRLLSRTVSYALVIGMLVALFFGIVGLATSMIPFESDLITAGATLLVAALFNPLRTRVRDAVDRRFNRSRYDSARVLDGFATTLRTQIDPDDVIGLWIDVVTGTMQPARMSMWMRSHAGHRSP